MPDLYPEIEPYAQGMLEVTGGDLIYWEVCGNPRGKPAVVLHGGPGSGLRRVGAKSLTGCFVTVLARSSPKSGSVAAAPCRLPIATAISSRRTAACCRILIPRFVNAPLLPGACGSPRHRIGLPCLDWHLGSVIRRSRWPMRGLSRITFVTMRGLAMGVSCVTWIGLRGFLGCS